jgi:hypothetical protein
LNDSLRTWQGSSIDLLRESSPEWLGALNSVADIWHVRVLLQSAFDFRLNLAILKQRVEISPDVPNICDGLEGVQP